MSILSLLISGFLHNPGTSVESIDLINRAQATIAWIQRAQQATQEGGISKGYDLVRRRWAPAYPETTGYTIPSLLNSAIAFNQPDLNSLAITLAEYLLSQATPEGGVVHWEDGSRQLPIVFDTGQVIFGWVAAYRAFGDERYLAAARRSAEWLVSIQDRSGAWKTHQYGGVTKVIDARVAWALLELHKLIGQDELLQSAAGNLNWVIQQQDDSGWFQHCSFNQGHDPSTHTLAYTAEALYETGCLLQEATYISAARKAAHALLMRQRKDGALAGTYGPGWSHPARWSCLTGDCQVARLWLRIYQASAEQDYHEGARRLIEFVARTQDVEASDLNLYGAIAGSFPVYGSYERLKYPNWAAKFFLDAVIQLIGIDQEKELACYAG